MRTSRQEPPPAPRCRRLCLLLVTCLVAAGGVAGLIAWQRARSTDPGQVVMAYLRASDTSDYKTSRRLMSRETQAQFDRLEATWQPDEHLLRGSSHEAPFVREFTGPAPEHEIFVKSIRIDGTRAEVLVGAREVGVPRGGSHRSGPHPLEHTYHCVREPAGWRLDFTDTLRGAVPVGDSR